ncbi:MAG: HAMP domain-containing histidine kinase [Devosia sp.]|uniref:sensor histidine kinase n=1 Tax=Devosia sp. TaxID=1871048 RepID=UPI001ACFA8C6|nr:HAMP domain-containing sensor histidine kinase [Devosia sp.]MBN9307970.1 HAMP domain-containing histidine kinase [Devosia sp.]MBN9315888.1 HAMP domain-containing histidine kinase [Devosia sp.]
MTVRGRIVGLGLASLAALVAMIAVMAYGLSLADHYVKRVDAVHRRFEAIAELDGRINAYGKEVASVLLLGRTSMPNVQNARIGMERTFARLTRATRDELAALDSRTMESEMIELEDVRRMIELYHAIDMSAARALAASRDGDAAQATELYGREVAFRLANELQPLVDSALTDERNEVATELAAVQRDQSTVVMLAGALALVSAAVLGGLGLLLHRSIRRSDARLEAEIADRTSELTAANARLRAVDVKRTQFLADVSHELRTPLTVLRGEADVALRGKASGPELMSALERIRGQSVELSSLLDDLIAYARSDAESQQHHPAVLKLEDIVAAAVAEGQVLAEPREVAVVTALGDGGARVDADFRRLRQALMIGLDNAVKHSPPGSRITVTTSRAGDRVGIAIADQGSGISEEDRLHVFERFYRGSKEGELMNQGLGIGLAIARDIIERHHGTIGLENGPEGGAVLAITLPVAAEQRP